MSTQEHWQLWSVHSDCNPSDRFINHIPVSFDFVHGAALSRQKGSTSLKSFKCALEGALKQKKMGVLFSKIL